WPAPMMAASHPMAEKRTFLLHRHGVADDPNRGLPAGCSAVRGMRACRGWSPPVCREAGCPLGQRLRLTEVWSRAAVHVRRENAGNIGYNRYFGAKTKRECPGSV